MLNPYCPFIITLPKESGSKVYNAMLSNIDMVTTATERMNLPLKRQKQPFRSTDMCSATTALVFIRISVFQDPLSSRIGNCDISVP